MMIPWILALFVQIGFANLLDLGRIDNAVSSQIGPEPKIETHASTSMKSGSFALRQIFYHDINAPVTSMQHIDANDLISNRQLKDDREIHPPAPLTIRTAPMKISKPLRLSWDSTLDRFANGQHPISGIEDTKWTTEEILGPDMTDNETVVNLAKMTSDAYVLSPDQPDWLNTTMGFNYSRTFGWESDGIRGHVFTDTANNTVIVSFKGSTVDPREKWRTNDKLNDNLLFSCCCGYQRPDPYWYGPVCGCKTGMYQCNSTCLTKSLTQRDRYYPRAIAVMQNITTWYPNASFWLVGHSLGGAMASLVGLTLNYPAVTFETPPERLPAQRLGLSIPPHPAVFHVGNTADPIYMGSCTGAFASCAAAGYNFESQCFTGKRCVYDTVSEIGWHVNVANHRINTVIVNVLEKWGKVPPCEADAECVDCYNWDFK